MITHTIEKAGVEKLEQHSCEFPAISNPRQTELGDCCSFDVCSWPVVAFPIILVATIFVSRILGLRYCVVGLATSCSKTLPPVAPCPPMTHWRPSHYSRSRTSQCPLFWQTSSLYMFSWATWGGGYLAFHLTAHRARIKPVGGQRSTVMTSPTS